MDLKLTAKRALVTGASKGIGKSCAMVLAQEGCEVLLVSRDGAALKELAAEIKAATGVKVDYLSADLSAKGSAKTVSDWAGEIDILVNNAGVGTAVPATHETPEQFRSVLDVNLFGAYWMAQAFAKANKDGGAIVNISSVLGLKPQGLPQAAYASSKAGIIGLTRDLAAQWTGRKNIRVNALAPGFFPSEMSDELPKDMVNMIKMFTPAGRLGDPEELAATLIWLVSDASSYVTGITVPVDGGLVMP